MPKKKTTKKKAAKKNSGKTLWNHISAVKEIQDPDYFSKLTNTDKKTWSSWMIFRALSYNHDYLPFVAEVERRCWRLSDEVVYKVLIDIFPKQRTYDKFIKGKNEGKYPEVLVDLISKHFEVSNREAGAYLSIFYLSDENKDELINILKQYGYSDKEIKKLKI